jgi:hypothetical protein
MASVSSSAALSASVSTSYQRTGSRFRSRRSRTSKARPDLRDAIRRSTPTSFPSSQARLAVIVCRTSSPNSGNSASISRSSGRSNAITLVGSTATPAAIVGSPVNMETSPMNVPPSIRANHTSSWGRRSRMSTVPCSMTKKGASRMPCSNSSSLVSKVRRSPRSASCSISASDSLGNRTGSLSSANTSVLTRFRTPEA